ncbi:succinate dehydrogenase assembly factor 2-A, mitochondrial-like [Coccinella septempunctata]|uniref:succinate dehydrogenase assembly factor 2-A, mitochondrial-like n=1 Tax=Coccinella septempunctata TaxID=41139 RepID=UPI001D094DD0|nr:succinate dehydrogenase assembly factor 2-A, mitochondrial-like [Coccinella septempunctata]
MNFLRNITFSTRKIINVKLFSSDMNNELINSSKFPELVIARPKRRPDETIEEKKARLLYQSRKRGMLENDLLLSTFASKYLKQFNNKQVADYDRMINEVSNDWDLYNWALGVKPIPVDYNNDVFKLFKEHVKNTKKETRFRQPDLY